MKSKSSFLKEQPAGSVPDCLLWELVRRNHSQLKKYGKKTFSGESHNVLSKHSPKYTGFSHKSTVDVKLNSTGSLVTYRTRKLGSSRRPSAKTVDKNFPKSLKLLDSLRKSVRRDRPDLTRHVLVKFAKLAKSKSHEKQES